MEISNLTEEHKPLLGRTNVSCKIFYKGTTPSTNDIAIELSAKLKKPRELLVIQSVYNAFGDTSAAVVCHVYEDQASLARLEPEYTQKKNAPPAQEEAPADPEAPAEAPVVENAPEAAQEEAPAEPEAPAEAPVEQKKEAE